MGKLLAIVSVILFGVAFVLFAFGTGNGKLIQDLTLLGFALFAGAHCV